MLYTLYFNNIMAHRKSITEITNIDLNEFWNSYIVNIRPNSFNNSK